MTEDPTNPLHDLIPRFRTNASLFKSSLAEPQSMALSWVCNIDVNRVQSICLGSWMALDGKTGRRAGGAHAPRASADGGVEDAPENGRRRWLLSSDKAMLLAVIQPYRYLLIPYYSVILSLLIFNRL